MSVADPVNSAAPVKVGVRDLTFEGIIALDFVNTLELVLLFLIFLLMLIEVIHNWRR